MPFNESFNGGLRDELLNETIFISLDHARQALANWKNAYDLVRPHSAIGNKTPMELHRTAASGETKLS